MHIWFWVYKYVLNIHRFHPSNNEPSISSILFLTPSTHHHSLLLHHSVFPFLFNIIVISCLFYICFCFYHFFDYWARKRSTCSSNMEIQPSYSVSIFPLFLVWSFPMQSMVWSYLPPVKKCLQFKPSQLWSKRYAPQSQFLTTSQSPHSWSS